MVEAVNCFENGSAGKEKGRGAKIDRTHEVRFRLQRRCAALVVVGIAVVPQDAAGLGDQAIRLQDHPADGTGGWIRCQALDSTVDRSRGDLRLI